MRVWNTEITFPKPNESACGCCDSEDSAIHSVYYFMAGQEGGFVFNSEYPGWNDYGCRELTERMSSLPCSRMQGSYVQNNTLRICSSACDALFDECGLPGTNLASSYNYTDGRSLCLNAWGGLDGSSSCDSDPDGALCQSGVVNIEVVDGDDCLGIDGRYPQCDGSSYSLDFSSDTSSSQKSYFNFESIFWPLFIISMLWFWWRWKRRQEQDAVDATVDTLPIASANPLETVPEPATQSIPVAAAVPEPPVTPVVVQATAVAPESPAAANAAGSIGDDQVTAVKQLTFDQEMDIQSLEFKLRMEMITQEQFDEAKREILSR